MSDVLLADLVAEVTSGDWGDAELTDDTDECIVVRGTDFQRLTNSDVSQTPHRFLKRSSILKRKLVAGDLLVEMSGGSEAQPTGRITRINEDLTALHTPVTFSNFVKRLRLTNEVDSQYFALVWESLYRMGKTRIYEKRTTGIRNFRLDDFLSSETIPLPPLDDQRKVALALSTIQVAIDANDDVIAKASQARQSCVRELFSNTETWKSVRLGQVARTSSGGTPRRGQTGLYGGSIPWVKSGEVRDNTIVSTEETITDLGLAKSSAKVFPEGTLLMAMYGATAGQVGILGMPAATNQAVCAIFPCDSVSERFLFFALQEARDRLRSERYGGAQPNLSQQTIQNFELSVPKIALQLVIATTLEAVDGYIESLKAKGKVGRQVFESSLQHLLRSGAG